MKQTNNLKLSLYEHDDFMDIIGEQNSLNHNTQIIDENINSLQQDTNNLNTRLDNLILNSDDIFAEVVDARVDSDGKTYTTLKERLDTEHSELKSDSGDIFAEVLNARVSSDGKTYTTLKERLDTEHSELKSDDANSDGRLVWSGNLSSSYIEIKDTNAIAAIEGSSKLIIKVGTASAITETIELQRVRADIASFGRTVPYTSDYYEAPVYVRQTTVTVAEDTQLQAALTEGAYIISYYDLIKAFKDSLESTATSLTNTLPAYLKEIYIVK